jgi:O-antigen ligase
MVYTFASLYYGSFQLGTSLPLPGDSRFGVWQNDMLLPAMLLLVAAVAPTTRQIKALIIVMCLAVFMLDRNFWNIVSGRDFSVYSEDLREGGAMGYAGTNGLAAFEAQFAIFLVALAGFERKRLLRLGYFALAVFSALCLVYSLSRGGYVALLVGWLFIGLTKQRKLLLLLIVFGLTWTALVPTAVQQRVLMTYDEHNQTLDHSAETRLTLWEDAMEVFHSNPALGTGFATYASMHRVGQYEDTHNFFLKVLVETGVVGLILFLWLLATTFLTGYRLFRRAHDPFLASLGLGLAAWVVCAVTANFFGDRWTYLQVSGYMWVIAGLVARAWMLERSGASATAEGRVPEAGGVLGAPNPQVADAV